MIKRNRTKGFSFFFFFGIVLGFPSHFPIHRCKLMALEFANSSWSVDELTAIEFMKTIAKWWRPKREWTAVEFFFWNDEAKAVGLINAETPTSALDGSKSTVWLSRRVCAIVQVQQESTLWVWIPMEVDAWCRKLKVKSSDTNVSSQQL